MGAGGNFRLTLPKGYYYDKRLAQDDGTTLGYYGAGGFARW